MREQIEPEGFFDDTHEETRPALGDEAKRALEMAEKRRNNRPIVDKDAETEAISPNDYHAALERLKAQRASGAPAPPPPATTRDQPREPDPVSALAQLTAQRMNGAPAPAPPPRNGSIPPPAFGNGIAGNGIAGNGIAGNGMSGHAPRNGSIPPPAIGNGITGTGPNRPLSNAAANEIPSARDLAMNVGRRSMVDAKPPSSASVPPPPPPTAADDASVLERLLGGPSSTAPNALNPMGPNAVPFQRPQLNSVPPGALSPQRTPAPIAVGGKGGGLLIATDRPGSMPPSGFGVQVKTAPSAQMPMRPSMPSRPPGAIGPGLRSTPPPALGPSNSTPPRQYDFKRWSSPEISEMPSDGSPVTFQVYTAQDVAQGRGPMRSMPMIDAQQQASSSSVAMKVGLAIVGGIIVLLTAAAVIMASTDEPKKPAPQPPPPAVSAPPSAALAPEEPAAPPTVIVIGDPNPPAPPAEEPAPAATTKKPKGTGGGGGGGGGGGAKSVTPPPNPYGTPGK